MKANDSGRVEHRAGYWWRVLRPLLWWLLLMLTMFGYRKHQALMERTRIYFTTTVPGLANSIAATVILDGEPISTGTKISLGSHTLTVTHPKAETFATNFFAWYGGHDFGQVTLKRTMGMLKVAANPAAGGISIFGPEFSLQLTNSTGTNISVPTDVYRVYARYARWSDVQEMTVSASGMACNFNPQLGAISISCNESPATYQISNAKGDSVAKGEVPAVVAELPGGDYLISVTFNEHQLDHTNVRVSAEQTNDVPFHFVFGAVRIDSVPTGATEKNGTATIISR